MLIFSFSISSFHQYFDLTYFFCPDRWKFLRLCEVVHKFSMDAIQRRKVQLEEAKVATLRATLVSWWFTDEQFS